MKFYRIAIAFICLLEFSGCGKIINTNSKIAVETRCDRNPEIASCNKSDSLTHEITSNPFSVTLSNSDKENQIVSRKGELSGLEVTLPKGSFEGPMKVEVEARRVDLGLINNTKALFGLIAPKFKVLISGTKKLGSLATITFPVVMTKDLTDAELKSLQVKIFSIEDTSQAVYIPASEIHEVQGASMRLLQIATSRWGQFEVIVDISPTPGTFLATTSVGTSGFTLRWSAASDYGEAASSLQYLVCSGTSSSAIDTVEKCEASTVEMPYTANTLTTAISARTPSTTYFFNVVTKDAANHKVLYDGITQSTTGDTSAPTAGTFSASTSVDFTAFSLNWSAASDNATSAASLQYLVCSGPSIAAIDTVAECEAATSEMAYTANVLTKSVTGKTQNTTYYYNVVVKDESNNKSIYNGVSQATTGDAVAPSAGTFSAVTSAGLTAFTLNWSVATDNMTATAALQYLVCSGASLAAIDSVAECEAATLEMAYSANILTKAISGKTPGSTYYYNVVVKDEGNNKSIYNGLTHTTTADASPPTPGMFWASTSVAASSFVLSWSAASDLDTPTASLQYFMCSGASAAAIDTVAECEAATEEMAYTANTLTKSFSGKVPSTTYYYNVVVKDTSNNKSIYIGITQVTPPDTTAPTPGSSGSITTASVAELSLTLNWSAAIDDVNSAALLQYYVCAGASAAAIDTVAECEAATLTMAWTANTLTKAVTGLTISTTYYFNVLVKDTTGNKNIYSGVTQATTADVNPPTPGSFSTTMSLGVSALTLYWTSASDTITTPGRLMYYICSAASAAAIDTVAECEAATQKMNWTRTLSKSVTGLTTETQHFFNVLVKDEVGNKSIYSGTSETTLRGVTTTNANTGSLPVRHSFYDNVNSKHWELYLDGSNLKTRYSSDGTVWTQGASTSVTTASFSLHFKEISGSGYVFVVTEENDYDIVLRRGAVGSSAITFDAPITVFDGSSVTNLYRNPAVTTDDSNLWIAASVFDGMGWQVKIKESTNVADASLATWSAVATLGSASMSSQEIALMPRGGEDLFALYKDGPSVVGYAYSLGSWTLASTGGESAWFTLPGVPSFTSSADVLALSGTDLYVGGGFRDAGGVPNTAYIAKWNGSSWSSLGPGLNASVYAMVVSGNDLYVAGNFTDAGGNANADYIAKWNGTTWSALGPGLNNYVRELIANGSDIYVGGAFTDAGGNTSADRIAKWDGTSWSALGAGFNNDVYALAFVGGDLYAGGAFYDVGGNTSFDFLAKWDGAIWSPVGPTLNLYVYSMAVLGSDLYISGAFTNAGGNANADNIAKWNGSVFTALGSGLNQGVSKVVAIGTDIYASGEFTDAGGNASADLIAKWNGTTWSALGTSLNFQPFGFAQVGTDLFVGGNFTNAGGNPTADYIAKWNGTTWSAIDSGNNGQVNALAVNGSDIYVGGDFTDLGGNASADRIAKWNGSNWSALGAGLNNTVNSLVMIGSDVYVGGIFTDAGGNASADRIAKWNGTTWSALGTGLNGSTLALAVSGTDLYAGGGFTDAGGNASGDYIAVWNGTAWSALGPGLNLTVNALAVSGANIYAGGAFTDAGTNASADRIAKWNGTTWTALGAGLNNNVKAMAISGSDLYAVGDFTDGGGNANADYIAKWNGTAWSALGTGTTGAINAIAVLGSDVYIGSNYIIAGGVAGTNFLAKWTGSAWQPVAAPRRVYYSLLASGGQLYAGFANGVAEFKPAVASGVTNFSATVNDTNDPMLLYTDVNGALKSKKFTSNTWSAASTVQASGASGAVLSWVRGLDDFFAFYFNQGAFVYKRFDGTTWDASATTLVNASTGARLPRCDEASGGGIIKCIVTSQSASPFDLTTWTVTP